MVHKISINEAAAPKEWVAFKRWHSAACKADPLSAEDRFRDMGYEVPVKPAKKGKAPITTEDDDKPVTDKVK